MTYQIRRATAGDLAAVETVTLSAYKPWVDIVGGRPGPMDEDFAVAVAPDHQGRGLGRQLITFAEATADRRGLRTTRLFTHERMVTNITWYERHGYVISRTEPLLVGRLVHMRKSLAQSES